MICYLVMFDFDDIVGLVVDIFLANKFYVLFIVEDDQLMGLVIMYDLFLYWFGEFMFFKQEEVFEEEF